MKIIEPERFAARMLEHWEKNLGNVGSHALVETWRWLGHHLNLHLQDHDSFNNKSQWYVLSAPTGTGKTQGVVTYCAMLAAQEEHPGVLLITRRIADAADIAAQVNQWGGRETAVAYHEGNAAYPKPQLGLKDLEQWPVLVITHAAFLKAFEVDEVKSKLGYFLKFDVPGDPFAERKMRIVDESLDIVKSMDICYDTLRQTWAAIPTAIMKRFPIEMQLIDETLERLRRFAFDKAKLPRFTITTGCNGIPDFTELAATAFPDRESEEQRKHFERLKSLGGIIKGPWSYLYSDKKRDSLNAARLLLGGGRGFLVLDATAGIDVVYKIHRESQIKLPPPNARRYDNVTLHASVGHRTGKRSTTRHAKEDIPRLLAELEGPLRGRKALFISHKDSQHVVQGYANRVPYTMATEHWGNLDGTNEFRDFDAVVLTSLLHLPKTWAINTFMALQGVQGAEWLLDDVEHPWGEYPDIRRALEIGKMAASVIQAINRIRCRRTIDALGNCPPADVYVKFGNEKQAQEILQRIVQAMPGIKVRPWEFSQTKDGARTAMKPDAAQTLLMFLRNLQPGCRLEKKTVVGKTGIHPRTLDRLIGRIRNPQDTFAQLVASLGVTIHVERNKRSFKAYFERFHHDITTPPSSLYRACRSENI